MGVLAALFGGSAFALRGGNKAATKAPPLNAATSDEADFIKYSDPLPRKMGQAPADTLSGSSWRRLRQRRSQRRSTKRWWTSIYGSLCSGIDCTTIDRTDIRSIKGLHAGALLSHLHFGKYLKRDLVRERRGTRKPSISRAIFSKPETQTYSPG